MKTPDQVVDIALKWLASRSNPKLVAVLQDPTVGDASKLAHLYDYTTKLKRPPAALVAWTQETLQGLRK